MLGDFEVRVLQKDSGVGCRMSRNPTPIAMARLLPGSFRKLGVPYYGVLIIRIVFGHPYFYQF